MKSIFTLLLGLFLIDCQAQFSLQATLRPRSELKNGYKTLKGDNQSPAFATSQRTRLSLLYQKQHLKLGISLQDIRIWGSQPQTVANDGAATMLSEAWAEVLVSKKLGIKLGRQALIYEDERILGGLDWLQQGRWHDAALVKYEDSLTKVHLGAAYNQGKENLFNTYYGVTNNYKHLHFLWAIRELNHWKLSALLLNNGLQVVDSSTQFSQTLGINTIYQTNTVRLHGSYYYQRGKDANKKELKAYLASVSLHYNPTKQFTISIGSDLLSGTPLEKGQEMASRNFTFNPLYGTHHKFYGLMDYFYVGNSHQEVGLWDKFVSIQHKPKGKFAHLLTLHQFSSQALIHNRTTEQNFTSHLGLEADYTFEYIFTGDIKLQGGYSHMFASPTLEFIKGVSKKGTQNWTWLMLTISTHLFKMN